MQVQLDEKLAKLLETIADAQNRALDDVLEEALQDYLKRHNFDADIQRILEEHRWLLDQLAR